MNRSAAAVLDELERACIEADRALREQRWRDCNAIWRQQRKLTHELEVSLRDLPVGTPERRLAFKRIERIAKYREGQLRRLRSYQAATGKQLQTIASFRRFSKTVGVAPKSRLLDRMQ